MASRDDGDEDDGKAEAEKDYRDHLKIFSTLGRISGRNGLSWRSLKEGCEGQYGSCGISTLKLMHTD